jgi:hypothetical protein
MEQRDLEAVEERLTSILLGWGVASTALGSALWVNGWRARRPELLRFGRQTAFWGATDAVIALAGARNRRRRGAMNAAEATKQAKRLLAILGVNTAADIVYIAGGVRVISRASAAQGTFLGMSRADGAAIVIQGAFLLVLDAAFTGLLATRLNV